ncbi:MAG: LicD family protein [Eubacteriales bacterium]|nr:LicD family protein [Eubacteriales bacterium]
METQVEIKEIQKCCLEIVKDIDRVCREHGIRYSLCGGSVIGAHLYQGFIPWDDDIDLMMTRKHYDKFLEVYPKYGNPRYHLHHYSTDGVQNLPALFSRVEDRHTRMTEEIAQGVRNGHVFVDITVFDNISGKCYNQFIHVYNAYIYTFLYRMNGMTPGTGWKQFLFGLLPKKVDENRLRKRYEAFENTCRRHTYRRKAKYCAELLSAAYSGILYEPRIFKRYTEIPFESEKLMIVKDYMDYLFMRYGKREFVKEMPDQDRQKPHIREFSVIEDETDETH